MSGDAGTYSVLKTKLLAPGDQMSVDGEQWTCSSVSTTYSSWACAGGEKTASWPHASLQKLIDGGLTVARPGTGSPISGDRVERLVAALEAIVDELRHPPSADANSL